MEAVPADPRDRNRLAEVLSAFGEPASASPKGVAVRLRGGTEQLADVVRALDAADLRVAGLQVNEPSLDDVFLARTGRSLEGAADDAPGEAVPA